MRGIVIAKMIGLALFGLYLAIGLTQPSGDENKPAKWSRAAASC
jgi:hypothetical protein